MKRQNLLFLVLLIFKGALAVSLPQGSTFDNRIQYVDYNSGDVVVIKAVAGIGVRLVFAANETILDVASGFTQGWEFSDRRNILYIKAKSIKGEHDQPNMAPEPGKWDTNLMVTTNLRLYDLDLHLLSGSNNRGKAPANQRLSYRIEFKYPQEIANKHQTQLKLDSKPAPRNWDYSMQVGNDSENIAPTMAFDDGRFTYLKFPNNRDFPSVFIVTPDKTEVLVNSHIDPAMPDTLVIQRVAPEIVLRLGQSVIGIYNDSFDPDGIATDQGTTVLDVKRILKPQGNY